MCATWRTRPSKLVFCSNQRSKERSGLFNRWLGLFSFSETHHSMTLVMNSWTSPSKVDTGLRITGFVHSQRASSSPVKNESFCCCRGLQHIQQACHYRFIWLTTFMMNHFYWSIEIPIEAVLRALSGTALVHWAPIKTTPRQFGIDWTTQYPTTKSHQATNVKLPASLTTLIDWNFKCADSKYLVVGMKVGIMCKWSRFEAEWLRGRVWRWIHDLNYFL